MEPVSLALGIIPIVGGSLKVYKSIYSKLRTFRHYSREVDRVRKHFDRQRQFFLNEVHFVLRLALDDEVLVKAMVADGTHLEWHSHRLESAIVESFGDNSRALMEIVEDVRTIINDVKMALECFSCLEEARLEDERLKDTVKRVRDRMKIAFDKSKFDKWTSDLRSSNNDLCLLRKQVDELCKPRARSSVVGRNCDPRRPMNKSGHYRDARKASQALHDALCAAWSTPDAAYFRHSVRLFLETKDDDVTQMDLAISCLDQEASPGRLAVTSPNGKTASSLVVANMMRVHVRSQAMDCMGAGLLATPPDSDSNHNTNRKRRRIVRFEDEEAKNCGDDMGLRVSSREVNLEQAVTLDLQSTRHFCSELLSNGVYCRQNPPATCVGYLDTRSHEKFRHSFFQCCEGVCNPNLCKADIASGALVRMDDVLAHPRSDELSVPSQLQLALRIVLAVLKFNSTSWLGECWGLQDLYFFEQGSDLTASLRTLHIGIEWSKRSPGELMEVDSAGDSRSFEDAKLAHGIRNATIYNLGVALLAIGRWAPVDSNDILHVRRMASQTCPLGSKYHEMTQRVLECDFGCGKDLSRPQLQQAIYDGIVLELESMIASRSLE
ncbi:hypothetical protein FPCIR_13107 [Fusarium pseudocircinatum]|uniref:Uncharacterized protein n=1 Tax=Fusarium pseudocircinatum TaxID=56676 RepID=A0A8H5KNA9_9HYPO|nr:hypothetical protein FPCIR_13107 [Fusarium pseudocircinatum]